MSRKLNLNVDEIDPNFGVVPLSLNENLYAILVDEATGTKLQEGEGVKGPLQLHF